MRMQPVQTIKRLLGISFVRVTLALLEMDSIAQVNSYHENMSHYVWYRVFHFVIT